MKRQRYVGGGGGGGGLYLGENGGGKPYMKGRVMHT